MIRRTMDEILERLRDLMPTLRNRYRVDSLAVFGSYVHGLEHEGSDLDLLVSFDDPPGLIRFIELENYLSEVLGVKVDLVMKTALRPGIGSRILSEMVPV